MRPKDAWPRRRRRAASRARRGATRGSRAPRSPPRRRACRAPGRGERAVPVRLRHAGRRRPGGRARRGRATDSPAACARRRPTTIDRHKLAPLLDAIAAGSRELGAIAAADLAGDHDAVAGRAARFDERTEPERAAQPPARARRLPRAVPPAIPSVMRSTSPVPGCVDLLLTNSVPLLVDVDAARVDQRPGVHRRPSPASRRPRGTVQSPPSSDGPTGGSSESLSISST